MSPARSSTPLIRIERLSKTYWTGDVAVPAVREASLTIEPGDFLAIMGPSGSGKSTLLYLLALLDVPTSGRYWLNGENIDTIDENDRADLRNRMVGFVFQQFYLMARTTALDNVALSLLYAGLNKRAARRRAYEMLKSVGLENRIDHHPNALSGGQQQRVSIARALVNQPMMLFCDEPTGNLDSTTSHEIMELLKQLNNEGKTIIMVTHEEEIAAYANRRVAMRDGCFLQTL